MYFDSLYVCIFRAKVLTWLFCRLMILQVVIPYKGGPRTYTVRTPSRKKSIKQLTRKTYVSMASGVINSQVMSKSVITQLAAKIKKEMKELSSDSHDSILRDSVEAVKRFSWETVRLELFRKVPTLMSLLTQIVNKPTERIPLLCLVASQLLKCRHQRLCLVQRAVSVMLYGNGSAKQVQYSIYYCCSKIKIYILFCNYVCNIGIL